MILRSFSAIHSTVNQGMRSDYCQKSTGVLRNYTSFSGFIVLKMKKATLNYVVVVFKQLTKK